MISGNSSVRKSISSALFVAGVSIFLLPKLIAFVLIALGFIVRSQTATDKVMREFKNVLTLLRQQF